MRTVFVPITLLTLLLPMAHGQELIDTKASIGLAGTSDSTTPKNLSTQETATIATTSPFFDLYTSLTANNDQKYGPDIANFKSGKTLFHNYYFINEGYMDLTAVPHMTFVVGRYLQKDTVESPYSLFFNSENLAASGATIRYEDDGFMFEDKWISLNSRSNFVTSSETPPAWSSGTYTVPGGTYTGLGLNGFPDRGSNYKAFVFKRGTMRFGFQDSVVYSGRGFDPNYFFSPVPQYFTQYFYAISGRPWSTNWTDKYAMGVFWDWKEPDFDAVAQVLLNDFSLHFLFPSQVPNNPWKAAWTFGGSVKTEWGRFGIYHAGALKYTFEPITFGSTQPVQNAVGYSYAPDVEYWLQNGFEAMKIEDNAIGYLHGENNLALMVTWDYGWSRSLTSHSSLEYLIAGNNSPANAWQGAKGNDGGPQLLNDPLLEQQVTLNNDWNVSLGSWSFFMEATLGMQFNPLGLEYADAGGTNALSGLIQIYKPQKGIQGIERFSIGGRYTFDVSGLFKP